MNGTVNQTNDKVRNSTNGRNTENKNHSKGNPYGGRGMGRGLGRGMGRGRDSNRDSGRGTCYNSRRNEERSETITTSSKPDTETQKKANDGNLSNKTTKQPILLKSRQHEQIYHNGDTTHDLSIIASEAIGWDNIDTLHETITSLKNSMATFTDKVNQNLVLDNIQKYEARYRELLKYQQPEKTDDNENMDDEESIINIPQWEDVVYINNEIKKYEIQAYQKRNYPKEETQTLVTLITTLKQRLNDLLVEETVHNLEHPEHCPQPDYQLIKEASDIAFYNSHEWDDLSFVSKTILHLQLEQTKESDEKQKKEIEVITNLYTSKKKDIIESMVDHDENLIRNGEVTFNNVTGEVKLPNSTNATKSKSQDDNMTNNAVDSNTTSYINNSDKNLITQHDEHGDIVMITASADEITINSNETKSLAESAKAIETPYDNCNTEDKKGSTTTITNSSLQQRSKTVPTTNAETPNINNNSNSISYSQAISGNNQVLKDLRTNDENTIRVRFQFKANDIPVGKKFGEQIKQKLHNIMICSKEIDKNNQLMPWKEASNAAPLHGKEIMMLGNDIIKEYVAAPKNPECLTRDKTYYHYGLRIKTTKTVKEFTEQWNNHKYNLTNQYPILQWVSMRPSEMQTSSTAYAVGYFMGSSERGDYKTLNEELQENFPNARVEVSFQTINQEKVSSQIWAIANSKAEATGTQPKSKASRTIKYKNSPSALVVYVDKKEHIREIKRTLYDNYGTIENENTWPTMPDGSTMLFAPILRGTLSDKVVKDLTESMEVQVALKADEVLLDIDIQNIHEKKPYLNNNSLEQIIHGEKIKINEATEIPIFKHICRKWMINASEVRYQVAVQTQMLTKAGNHIQTLRNHLIKKYGPDIQQHFRSKITQHKTSYSPHPTGLTNQLKNEDDDPEMVTRIINNKNGGIYGKVMLTGMHLLQLNNKNKPTDESPKAMLINTGKSDESMSGVTSTSRSTQGNITWGKDTNENERTSESQFAQEREKIITSCVKYDIKFHEVENWIRENIKDVNEPIHKWSMQQIQEYLEYTKWKTILIDIKNTRKKRYKNDRNTHDEFHDSDLDVALSKIPSEDLLSPPHNTQEKASHLPHEMLSHLPTYKDKKSRNDESHGQ